MKKSFEERICESNLKSMHPRKCPACGGTGKVNAVWYGQPTGKKTTCQLCYGTGKSNANRLF